MFDVSVMVTKKQKMYSRYMKDKEKVIKAYHCRK